MDLVDEIEKLVRQECEKISTEENPMKKINEYHKSIRWEEPELAAYLKKKMLNFFNFDD